MTKVIHITTIEKDTPEALDFENNYKSISELVTDYNQDGSKFTHEIDYTSFKNLIDGANYRWSAVFYDENSVQYNLYVIIGKEEVMTTSRPAGTNVIFTGSGDIDTQIGGGTEAKWDFSNTDNDVTAPTGYKRKILDLSFIDNIWIKEGSVYFFNAPKGCYVDFQVVCPSGQYYIKNDGTPALASVDTVILDYVHKHYLQGSCPMGDELNTEAATLAPLPTNYKMRIQVTTPDTDNTSNGRVEIEMYRTRTVILN